MSHWEVRNVALGGEIWLGMFNGYVRNVALGGEKWLGMFNG